MSLSDWESDLTELTDSDEDYVPQKKTGNKRGRPPKHPGEYKISNSLNPPRAASYSTNHLYEMLVDGSIDLDPPYQRDVVWPESKQIGLIDSIMRNYYVPPIIFSHRKDPETEHVTRVCIDGKQRLTSLLKFCGGQIPHRDSITSKKYWFKGPDKQGHPMLPQQLINNFKTRQVVCMEYDLLSEEQEREIFQRVQLGVALTPAERMQAISGPWPDLVREIQSVIIGEDGFADALEWGSGRGRDFQCLATIVYLILNYNTNAKFPGAAQLDKWLHTTSPVPSDLRENVLESFKIFVHLARDEKLAVCFQKPTRVSPVEFTMTGVLIYILRKDFTFTQISSAIAKMRGDVRKSHVDIRANTKVVKTMLTFLKNIKPSMVRSDPKDKIPASRAIRNIQKARTAEKRKRDEAELDDEEPPRRAAPAKSTNGKSETTKAKSNGTTSKAAQKSSASSGTKVTVKKAAPPSTSTQASTSSRARDPPSSKASPVEPRSTPSNAPALPSLSSIRRASQQLSSSSSGPPLPRASDSHGQASNPRRTSTDASINGSRPPSRAGPSDLQARTSVERAPPSLSRRQTPNSSTMEVDPPAVKPEPLRRSSVSSRLAVIHNAKHTADRGPNSPVLPSPTTSTFANRQQFSPPVAPASAPPALRRSSLNMTGGQLASPVNDCPPPPVPLPRTATEPAIQSAASQNSPTAAPPRSAVQSILAMMGLPSGQNDRRGSADSSSSSTPGPAGQDSASAATRDPRRRPSNTPSASPNQPFFTPAFASGMQDGAAAAQGAPVAPATNGASPPPLVNNGQAENPPVPSSSGPSTSPGHQEAPASPSKAHLPLSPTLPKKPDVRPEVPPAATDMRAAPMQGRPSRWDQPHVPIRRTSMPSGSGGGGGSS